MDLKQGLEWRRPGEAVALVHAVPPRDRTRSALCGRRVKRIASPWHAEGAASCPECVRWALAARSA